jgi:purine-cytosine permease-like protein
MKLLEFVALYGLLLMPMGAVIMMDIYVLPKFNLKSNFAEFFNRKFNPSAAISWVIALLFALFLNIYFGVEVFFLGLPGWFVASLVYIISSKIVQQRMGKSMEILA